MTDKKVLIQGYNGSFHEEAAHAFFDGPLEPIPCSSFSNLALQLDKDPTIDYAIMAIENSIAGTILQNYRLLRDYNFCIIGEIYLQINMNLMVIPGQKLSDIKEIHSHPMALYQCTQFLNPLENMKPIESADTALSAKEIKLENKLSVAAIASATAAKLYDLEIIAAQIQDNPNNYTRFFVLQKNNKPDALGDKATVFCRLPHQQGSLSEVLSVFNDLDINLSSLQSYPILGMPSQYFFHMDLEFKEMEQFKALKNIVPNKTTQFQTLGIYNKASIPDFKTPSKNIAS